MSCYLTEDLCSDRTDHQSVVLKFSVRLKTKNPRHVKVRHERPATLINPSNNSNLKLPVFQTGNPRYRIPERNGENTSIQPRIKAVNFENMNA